MSPYQISVQNSVKPFVILFHWKWNEPKTRKIGSKFATFILHDFEKPNFSEKEKTKLFEVCDMIISHHVKEFAIQ